MYKCMGGRVGHLIGHNCLEDTTIQDEHDDCTHETRILKLIALRKKLQLAYQHIVSIGKSQSCTHLKLHERAMNNY
jgi:hypothetical protein